MNMSIVWQETIDIYKASEYLKQRQKYTTMLNKLSNIGPKDDICSQRTIKIIQEIVNLTNWSTFQNSAHVVLGFFSIFDNPSVAVGLGTSNTLTVTVDDGTHDQVEHITIHLLGNRTVATTETSFRNNMSCFHSLGETILGYMEHKNWSEIYPKVYHTISTAYEKYEKQDIVTFVLGSFWSLNPIHLSNVEDTVQAQYLLEHETKSTTANFIMLKNKDKTCLTLKMEIDSQELPVKIANYDKNVTYTCPSIHVSKVNGKMIVVFQEEYKLSGATIPINLTYAIATAKNLDQFVNRFSQSVYANRLFSNSLHDISVMLRGHAMQCVAVEDMTDVAPHFVNISNGNDQIYVLLHSSPSAGYNVRNSVMGYVERVCLREQFRPVQFHVRDKDITPEHKIRRSIPRKKCTSRHVNSGPIKKRINLTDHDF